jgi:hypothetical protein
VPTMTCRSPIAPLARAAHLLVDFTRRTSPHPARKSDGLRTHSSSYWCRRVHGRAVVRLTRPTLSPMNGRLTHELETAEPTAVPSGARLGDMLDVTTTRMWHRRQVKSHNDKLSDTTTS